MRNKYTKTTKRWIVKIGSALITQDGKGLDHKAVADWSKQMAELRHGGIEIVLVSSGAVAEGMSRMQWKQRPKALHELQAAAAIGQMGLVQAYETSFKEQDLQAAQVLLTHDELSNRKRYLNARSTLQTLLKLGTLPIVNENDTVSYDEIKLGDNDTLGALVANLIEADLLIILTDQQGLFDKDPRSSPDAKLIEEDKANNPDLLGFAGPSGTILGSGGMTTKILAAQRAARSGCATIIASGREEDVLGRIRQGENIGSLLVPDTGTLAARKQWIAGQLQNRGKIWLDQGAVEAITKKGKSILPIGVSKIEGDFKRGDVVSCLDENNQIIAQGFINYSSSETMKIKQKPSSAIESELGYIDESELMHRDNLVIM